jgi:predicted transcriptional regulator
MKAAEWIDRVKTVKGWDSDYRVAKELSLSRATVSKYRGPTTTFDEETAIKVATALGEKPEALLLDQFAERVKDQAISTALHNIARGLCVRYVK